MSFFSHLECSVPCGAPTLNPRERHFLCSCGAPLLARYDLDAARRWAKDSLAGREPNMWRYRELMPLFDGEEPITLGEGFTPLFHARSLGRSVGLDRRSSRWPRHRRSSVRRTQGRRFVGESKGWTDLRGDSRRLVPHGLQQRR